MDFSPIISKLITIEDANELLVRLGELQATLYGREENFEKALNKVNVRYFSYLNDGLAKNNRKEYLEKLISEIKSMDKIGIKISFIPSQGLAEQISSWLEMNIGKKVLLAVDLNKTKSLKVGLEWQGRYEQF